ncbi:MAG: hypothetical protein VB049_04980 [Candidatus Pelethousia sp.]|nr:hypothetical protein [Candidatus Pelethousia sp.]
MYLTFAEYQAMGGTLDSAAFSRWEYSARALIDRHTFKRVDGMAEIPECVKRLTFELIGMAEQQGKQQDGATVTSFNTDGYSESYAKPMTATEAAAAMDGLVWQYLSGETDDNGTPLLYRGVG